MMNKYLIVLLLVLSGCFSLSERVSLPVKSSDQLLRISIVKDLAFIIRENPEIENSELKALNIYRGVYFTSDDKLTLINKARRINDDWDGD
jgi:hypothetical protein